VDVHAEADGQSRDDEDAAADAGEGADQTRGDADREYPKIGLGVIRAGVIGAWSPTLLLAQ
jgi:hypothetical protein